MHLLFQEERQHRIEFLMTDPPCPLCTNPSIPQRRDLGVEWYLCLTCRTQWGKPMAVGG